MSLPLEYQKPEGLRTLANYLRSQNGVKVRSGIEHEKRVEYFKGKRLIECILEGKKWPRSIPKVSDAGVARLVSNALVQANFFHRSEKVPEKKGYLKISEKNVFEETGYYTWMYAGNMVWSNIATGAVIAVVIGFTLLPIWPDAAKKILWYISVTFLIGILSFCLIRFLLFLLLWLFGYEFWVFPRLFDESLSFQDSFKPVYTFEKGSAGQGYYRVGMLLVLVGFVYWACTQPTEFDGFLQAQKDFIDDIYSGNLLADVAQDARDNIDRTKRVPSIEDLLRELDEEKISITDKVSEEALQAEAQQGGAQGGERENEGENEGDMDFEYTSEGETEEEEEEEVDDVGDDGSADEAGVGSAASDEGEKEIEREVDTDGEAQ